jgi:uncharacterized protein YjbI with pentapeptide repeats
MLSKQNVIDRLAAAGDDRGAIFWQQPIGDVDFAGHVFDRAVNFVGAIFQGRADFSAATFRGHASFSECRFLGGCQFVGARFEDGATFSETVFAAKADFYQAAFVGKARFWRARFREMARFDEVEVSVLDPTSPRRDGVADFSWSWFDQQASFEYAQFRGAAYFWRTLFRRDAVFRASRFGDRVLFAGNPPDLLFPRFGVINPTLVSQLEQVGLFRPDSESSVQHGSERFSKYVLFTGVYSFDHLCEQLDQLGTAIAPSDRAAIEAAWQEGARSMFASGTAVSFGDAVFDQMAKLTFDKVDLTGLRFNAEVAGPPEVKAAFGAALVGDSYDLFMSHATADKEAIVRPLVAALRKCGQRVWYDEEDILVGKSLRQAIDDGLARAHFGVVVLSPSFLARAWTQYELESLLSHTGAHGPRILPVWFGLSEAQVAQQSAKLADVRGLKAESYTIDGLALALVMQMKGLAK